MNEVEGEGRELLLAELACWRAKSYGELVALIDSENHSERTTGTGSRYGLEVSIHWDDRAGGAVRVIGNVDLGGWTAFVPWTDDFIKAPDGSFVGE